MLRKVFRLSDITGHQCRDSGLAMDNPQLAKATPQLRLHPALIPPYCNPAFVPLEGEKRRGVLVSKRGGEQRRIEAGEEGE